MPLCSNRRKNRQKCCHARLVAPSNGKRPQAWHAPFPNGIPQGKDGTGRSLPRQMDDLRFLPWPSPAHGKALLETLDLGGHLGLRRAVVKCGAPAPKSAMSVRLSVFGLMPSFNKPGVSLTPPALLLLARP